VWKAPPDGPKSLLFWFELIQLSCSLPFIFIMFDKLV
jgi:hypothetical protein